MENIIYLVVTSKVYRQRYIIFGIVQKDPSCIHPSILLEYQSVPRLFGYLYNIYHCLKSYIVEKKVRLILYFLKLLPILQRLHLVFPVVKLITILNNSISRRCSSSLPDLVIINKKQEWKVERILNRCQYYKCCVVATTRHSRTNDLTTSKALQWAIK